MSSSYQTVILGAGLCGLSAAYHLEAQGDADYLILERDERAGGLARTEKGAGFSFDHAIHILYSRDPYAEDLICNSLLRGNIRRTVRQSYCYTEGVFTEYPYQANTFGLPKNIVLENLTGLIRAKIAAHQGRQPRHFEEWLEQTFGHGIAGHFLLPYNRRQWAWDLKEMSYDWTLDRVPVPEMAEVLQGALFPPQRKHGPNREFWYPERGGIASLPQAFLRFIPADRLRLKTTVTAIDGVRHEVVLDTGSRIRYRRLISTVPLPALIRLLGTGVPAGVRDCARGLKGNMVHTVNIGLDGPDIGPLGSMHWAYFPEDRTIFHRASVPGNFSPSMVPDGCSSLQLEISESVYRPCNRETLIERCLADLIRAGILEERDRKRVLLAGIVTLDPAYIIYDLQHRNRIRILNRALRELHIRSSGRFGEWEYLNMDQAILSGKRAAEEPV